MKNEHTFDVYIVDDQPLVVLLIDWITEEGKTIPYVVNGDYIMTGDVDNKGRICYKDYFTAHYSHTIPARPDDNEDIAGVEGVNLQ